MVDAKGKEVVGKTESVESTDKVTVTKKMYVLTLAAAAAIGAGTATIADYDSKDAIVEQRIERETFLLDEKDKTSIDALLAKESGNKVEQIQQACMFWNDVDHPTDVNTLVHSIVDKKEIVDRFTLNKTDKAAIEKIFQDGAGCQAVKKRFGIDGCDIEQVCLFWNDVDHPGRANVKADFGIDALIAANEED